MLSTSALLSITMEIKARQSELAKRVGIDDDGSTEGWVKYTEQLNAKIALWHKNLSPEYRKYCNDRGITDETINEIRIGQTENGRLAIPYYKNGYVAYYITRAMPGSANPEQVYEGKERRIE